PTTSWPGTRGQSIGNRPSTVAASEWQTPQASTRIRTWFQTGSTSGLCTSENLPAFETSIALYVAVIVFPRPRAESMNQAIGSGSRPAEGHGGALCPACDVTAESDVLSVAHRRA